MLCTIATWLLGVAGCLALGVLSEVVQVDPRGSTFTQARRSHRCHTHSQSRTPTVYSIHFQYRVYVMLASAIAVQYVALTAFVGTLVTALRVCRANFLNGYCAVALQRTV